ncbi:MAG: heme exporter protein CcmD [Pseudomonadota bacterium]|jgi:heme exporter protein D
MSEFFAMGGYAFYVWTSYGLTFALMFIGIIKPLIANKHILRTLELKRKWEQKI